MPDVMKSQLESILRNGVALHKSPEFLSFLNLKENWEISDDEIVNKRQVDKIANAAKWYARAEGMLKNYDEAVFGSKIIVTLYSIFSAGKSSLINALTGADTGSAIYRTTGDDPTDVTFTLIGSDPHLNVSDFFNYLSDKKCTSIDGILFLDTPGFGHIASEFDQAEACLLISDIILSVHPRTRVFDEDFFKCAKPALFDTCESIQKAIVITNSGQGGGDNEFMDRKNEIIDRTSLYVGDDGGKYRDQITETPFFQVDSLTKFGIEKLMELIRSIIASPGRNKRIVDLSIRICLKSASEIHEEISSAHLSAKSYVASCTTAFDDSIEKYNTLIRLFADIGTVVREHIKRDNEHIESKIVAFKSIDVGLSNSILASKKDRDFIAVRAECVRTLLENIDKIDKLLNLRPEKWIGDSTKKILCNHSIIHHSAALKPASKSDGLDKIREAYNVIMIEIENSASKARTHAEQKIFDRSQALAHQAETFFSKVFTPSVPRHIGCFSEILKNYHGNTLNDEFQRQLDELIGKFKAANPNTECGRFSTLKISNETEIPDTISPPLRDIARFAKDAVDKAEELLRKNEEEIGKLEGKLFDIKEKYRLTIAKTFKITISTFAASIAVTCAVYFSAMDSFFAAIAFASSMVGLETPARDVSMQAIILNVISATLFALFVGLFSLTRRGIFYDISKAVIVNKGLSGLYEKRKKIPILAIDSVRKFVNSDTAINDDIVRLIGICHFNQMDDGERHIIAAHQCAFREIEASYARAHAALKRMENFVNDSANAEDGKILSTGVEKITEGIEIATNILNTANTLRDAATQNMVHLKNIKDTFATHR